MNFMEVHVHAYVCVWTPHIHLHVHTVTIDFTSSILHVIIAKGLRNNNGNTVQYDYPALHCLEVHGLAIFSVIGSKLN